MRIDGSTLNPFWAQRLESRQDNTTVPGVPTLGKDESGPQFIANNESQGAASAAAELLASSGSSASVTRLAQEMSSLESSQDAFALEMTRRLSGLTDAEGEEKDPTALVGALNGAVSFIRQQHGDDAATASMAMILGSTGGRASEDSLGNGLVKVLQFVDDTYGYEAGDRALVKFNGELNRELNGFFENGLSEKFLVADDVDATSIAMSAVKNRYARRAAESADDDGEAKTANEALLEELAREMEQATNPEELAKRKMEQAQQAYGFIASPEPQFLSASV
ncbi:MAG: hypothetical protein AB7D51_00755 [Desulfovibrionaceae bacterium]